MHQIMSVATLARARYSTLVLERATTFCFLELHATRLPLRKIQMPVTDFQSSKLLPQSETEYPLRVRKEEECETKREGALDIEKNALTSTPMGSGRDMQILVEFIDRK